MNEDESFLARWVAAQASTCYGVCCGGDINGGAWRCAGGCSRGPMLTSPSCPLSNRSGRAATSALTWALACRRRLDTGGAAERVE